MSKNLANYDCLATQFGVSRFKGRNQPVQTVVDALPRHAVVEAANPATPAVTQAVDAFIG